MSAGNSEFVYDDRSQSYAMVGDMLATIARCEYGVSVDDLTLQRWRQAAGLMREFDTLADDSRLSTEQAMEIIDDYDVFRDQYPELDHSSLPLDVRQTMVSRVAYILHLGELLSHEEDPLEFRDLRGEEATQTTMLFVDCASEATAEQPQFADEFVPTLISLGKVANYGDSIVDARRDYIERKIAIKPDRKFYSTLGRAALHEWRLNGSAMISPKMIKLLVSHWKSRLSNRLDNKPSSYSSINSLLPSRLGKQQP